ncbi:amino acid adenylation domain-containing protein [Tumebacillus sp. DT12]|uniref:Amino acid adenylation domain-containing protein n=1 Tax=Tumebacillus lacus TaxID=2995335 RepID=A0ABT3WXR1_9BACL|nr:amino acid adenylation domain-containing protein [Tumebacillus lacus]MCX7569416.1 amino acid adenylation domain-containing protein [Tumebacillus lacus]
MNANDRDALIQCAVRFTGAIHADQVQAMMQQILARHEIFRTARPGEELSCQLLHRAVCDAEELLTEERRRAAEEQAARPFWLAWVQENEEQGILCLTMHACFADSTTLRQIVEELFQACAGTFQEEDPQEERLQYQDIAAWSSSLLEGEDGKLGQAFWLEEHSLWRQAERESAPRVMGKRTDAANQGAFQPGFVRRKIGAPLSETLRTVSTEAGLDVRTLILGAWQALLSRLSSGSVVSTGVAYNGRNLPVMQGVAGPLSKHLPVARELTDDTYFMEGLDQLQEQLELFADWQEYFTLDLLESSTGQAGCFQSCFDYVQQPTLGRCGGLTLEWLDSYECWDRFDVKLICFEQTDGYEFVLYYDADLMLQEGARQKLNQLILVLEQVCERSPLTIGSLNLLTVEEEHLIRKVFTDTAVEYDLKKNLHQWMEEQVDATPDAVAVVFGEETLTYRELDRQANRLAHHLVKQGVQANDLVGVSMERSLEMVVGLLGILKAGGAYLPLDPDHPAERMAFVLEDSQVRIVLTQEHLADALPSDAVRTICLDRAAEKALLAAESAERTGIRNTAEDTAYCIYTSGSTGKPKGALISHQGICNRLLWMQDEYRLNAEDRVLQKTPYSFDVSVWEFFWPLMTGARLVVAEPGGHRDTRYLARLIAREGITTLHFVPSMLHVFLEEPEAAGCTSIRRVICSGEALPLGLQQRFFERLGAVELHNLYGPTEASVDVSYWQCQADSDLPFVPIGRPIANIKLYILDERMQPVPIGVAGELYISGIGVAKGYLNRPELTAERFVPDPFDTGANMYKTGDAARWLPDGNIEYIGRLDNQVKLRGLRIELGEVESVLGQHPAVREAVVTVREDEPNQVRLVGYVVPRTGGVVDEADVYQFLSRQLPEYMLPASLVVLKEMPLTSSGKVNRFALPQPANRRQAEFVAPRTMTEQMIASIWQEVLQLESIGVHDEYHALGGNSIRAIQLVSQITSTFQVEFGITEFFDHPTIAKLGTYLDELIEANLMEQLDGLTEEEMLLLLKEVSE